VIGPYPVPPPQLGLTVTLQCEDEKSATAPEVTSLSQESGPPDGGTVLTVLGTNFTPSSTVTFGDVPAKAVTYLSPQALTVTTPEDRGLVDVRVTTAGGTSAEEPADRFFFGSAPTVTKVSPARGPDSGGTTVTITGTGFAAVTEVSFGGVPARTFTLLSATTIVAVTGTALPGPVAVQVTNPAGTSPADPEAAFRYLAPGTASRGPQQRSRGVPVVG
jgi:IPT/TIG domain